MSVQFAATQWSQVLAKLEALTNLRVVEDPSAETGWRVEMAHLPRWSTVPEW